MKKILLSVLISGGSICSFAQTPTMDMESWTTTNNGSVPVPEEPTGWVTGNQLVNPISTGNDTSVFKATGADAHTGSAMKITTVDVVNNPVPTQIPDPAGMAFTGKVSIVGFTVKIVRGVPFTNRPANCEFWYKYSPQAGDSASCLVTLSKWNGTSRDIIGSGTWRSEVAQGSYIQQIVAITPNAAFLNVVPDTLEIDLSATRLASPTVGSVFWVDDMALTGSTGINENPSSLGVMLFPNPASDFVTISSDVQEVTAAIISDVTGRVITTSTSAHLTQLSTKEWSINTSGFSPGVYSYSLVDKNNAILRAGKFNVAR